MTVRWALISLLTLLVSGPLPEAEAQSKSLSCEDNPPCAKLLEQGLTASQQLRFDDALRAYENAYRLSSDPNLLYNRARVLHKAGQFDAAVSYYQKFLDVPTAGTDEQRRKAEQYLEQTRTKAAIQPNSKNEPPRTPPLYQRWWLWTAVGVVAAGVAVGVGLGIASRQPDTTGACPLAIPK